MSLEEDAQRLITALEGSWEATWSVWDTCRDILDRCLHDDGYVHALSQVTGVATKNIRRWAKDAELVPPPERAQDLSPRWQVQKAARGVDTNVVLQEEGGT